MAGLALDLGTGSVKAIAATSAGVLLGEVSIPLETLSEKPGQQIQNPFDVLQAAKVAVTQVIEQLDETTQVDFLSLSAAMHSIIAVDSGGTPLTPAYLWSDNSSMDILDALREDYMNKNIYEITGAPLHPSYPLSKIKWLKTIHPEWSDVSIRFISIKEWLVFHLSGMFLIDYPMASATGMFDIHRGRWNDDALCMAGITHDALSTPAPMHTIIPLLPKAAGEWHLPVTSMLVLGGSDGGLAALAGNLSRTDSLSVTAGTSAAVRYLSKSPWRGVEKTLFSYLMAKDQFLIGAPVNNAGLAIQWLKTIMPINDQTISAAFGLRPGAAGLICLPYVSAERAPVWDASASGIFLGIRLHHETHHFLRALLEGIAFSLLQCASPLMRNYPIRHLESSGAFSKMNAWNQLLADVFQLPVSTVHDTDASAMGAMKVGFEATAQVSEFRWAEGRAINYPQPSATEDYLKLFGIFRELYPMHQMHFKQLQSFF